MMDNERRNSIDAKEGSDNSRRNSKDNTEYLPTRCRITKPIPPKPAANPMQFVKIAPCGLFRKAQEQIKKVEEIKMARQEIRDDAEDWQANLDNWKSSRRKRQEHIIERVVEVKKFEQQEMEKTRRRSKTFNEILEERSKRKNKFATISLYENDDPNDLSDYGIGVGQSSGDTSSNVVTDDEANSIETDSTKESKSWQDDISERKITDQINDHNNSNEVTKPEENQSESNIWKNERRSNDIWNEKEEESNTWNAQKNQHNYSWNNDQYEMDDNNWIGNKNEMTKIDKDEENNSWVKDDQINNKVQQEPQHTYESAIQGYRTRVISKTNLNPNKGMLYPKSTVHEDKTDPEMNTILPKGSILKRKELFENEKVFELNNFESNSSRRVCDDFAHSQSLKERLLSLEKFTEQPLLSVDSRTSPEEMSSSSTKSNPHLSEVKPKPAARTRMSMLDNIRNDFEKSKPNSVINSWSSKNEILERSSSPETEIFVNKIENFHRSLDNLTDSTNELMPLERVQSLEGLESCHSASNYPASNSSTELLVLSSQYGDTDREDSGIHTADVSCSVSQADEPVEDSDISPNTNGSTEDTILENSVVQPIVPVSTQNVEVSWNNDNMYVLDNVFTSEEFPLGPLATPMEPPKEKPPPPPVNITDEDAQDESELKHLNSATRIKKEIRLKRSSFLGIDPDDQIELEATVRKPPDISSFLQKESRLEKQLYKKTQGSYSEAGDSQDSGVELERGRLSSDTWCSSLPDCRSTPVHGRQDSEPYTTNSITSEEDEITKKEREIIELVEKEEQWRGRGECEFINEPEPVVVVHDIKKNEFKEQTPLEYETAPVYITSEDDDHSEVLRVEHELLQLEREEMERQRENMIFQESRARLQSKNCLKNKRLSLEDITSTPMNQPMYMYQPDPLNYRKSMPELQHDVHIANFGIRAHSSGVIGRSHVSPIKHIQPAIQEQYGRDKYVRKSADPLESDRMYQHMPDMNSKVSRPIARHSLQSLSTAPRPRINLHDSWLQPKQSSVESREKFNYNQHWLIQEAEQRRISEQKYPPHPNQSWKITRPEKHLPDSVIQTLTQRVQNKVSLSEKNALGRRVENIPNLYNPHTPHSVGHALPIHHPHLMEESQDKMLSVSGKKKCSYCGNELGRGAAMIIESLCLFYHMDCFKCCVCHVQLGDGLMGTDVRVRNNKLHCHNCYSSDDGVKFSCV